MHYFTLSLKFVSYILARIVVERLIKIIKKETKSTEVVDVVKILFKLININRAVMEYPQIPQLFKAAFNKNELHTET